MVTVLAEIATFVVLGGGALAFFAAIFAPAD